MTVAAIPSIGSTPGTGTANGVYPFAFKTFSVADIQIQVTTIAGVTTTLPSSAYTVTRNQPVTLDAGCVGGTVLIPQNIPTTSTVTISRVMPVALTQDVIKYPFSDHKVSAIYDRIVMLIQQINDQAIIASQYVTNVKLFGASGNGTTDDTVAIQKAASNALATGRALYAPAGTYRINAATIGAGNFLAFTGSLRFFGDGRGVTILQFFGSSVGWTGFSVTASDVTISEMTVNDQSTGSGSYNVVIAPGAGSNRLRLKNISLIGRQAASNQAHMDGIHWVDAATCDGMEVTGCHLFKHDYGMFTDNGFSGSITNLRVTGCYFSTSYADDIELNTPGGLYINDVVIEGNNFYNNQSTGPASGFGVGLAQVANITISDNTFNTYPLEAIHIENGSVGVVVSDNSFINTFFGIHIYQGTANPQTRDITITGNVMQGTGVSGSSGITIVYDVATYQVMGCNISDNVVDGFVTGITWGINIDRCTGRGNIIRNATTGMIMVQNGCGRHIDDNTFDSCTYCYQSGDSLVVGRTIICGTLATPKSTTFTGYLTICGLVVRLGTATIPAGSPGSVNIATAIVPAPSIYDGKGIVTWGNTTINIQGSLIFSSTYNGTSVTNTTIQEIYVGPTYATGLAVSGGNLLFSFYNGTSQTSANITLAFDGQLVW